MKGLLRISNIEQEITNIEVKKILANFAVFAFVSFAGN
jgi:hypothetical protein